MHQHDEHCGCGEYRHGSDQTDPHHTHDEHCGCGEHRHGSDQTDHHHTHDEHCGCGEHRHGPDQTNHHHTHDEHCGCGHAHVPIVAPEGLSSVQTDILLMLRQRRCLPVACFTLTKAGDVDQHMVALSPVYLGTPDDTMEQVKSLGAELLGLEDMDLITLDYDIPLREYPYEEYKNSALYAYFLKTVEEANQRQNATFDTPVLELGSMALTDSGEEMVDALIKRAES